MCLKTKVEVDENGFPIGLHCVFIDYLNGCSICPEYDNSVNPDGACNHIFKPEDVE